MASTTYTACAWALMPTLGLLTLQIWALGAFEFIILV
jgi:hypothetical protein